MAQVMKIVIDGKEYTLHFTRKTFVETEELGFEVDRILSNNYTPTVKDVITQYPILFHGALLADYPEITKEEADDLLDKVEGKDQEFWTAIITLFTEPINTLIDQNGKAKNKNWGVN